MINIDIKAKPNPDCYKIDTPSWLIHDLLQPMQAVQIARDLLLEEIQHFCDAPELINISNLLNSAVDELSAKLSILNKYWDINLKSIPVHIQPIDLRDVIETAISWIASKEKRLDFSVTILTDITVQSDPIILKNILSHLSRSIFSSGNSSIEVSCNILDEQLRIEVCGDRAHGAPVDTDRLGEPFYTQRLPKSGSESNLGLDIYLAAAYAERLPNCKIRHCSNSHGVMRFYVDILAIPG